MEERHDIISVGVRHCKYMVVMPTESDTKHMACAIQ